jgi:hypothetical protein
MTNKEKIKYLSQYSKLALEYKLAHNKYLELSEKFNSPGAGVQRLSFTPTGEGSGNPIEEEYFRLLMLEEILHNAMKRLDSIKGIIFDLDDPLHRTVLRLRYIDGLSWEKICVEINYEWAWTHRIHSNALDNISIS